MALAQEFLDGQYLPNTLHTPVACSPEAIDSVLSWDGLSTEASAGIYFALRNRGGVLLLSSRLPDFTHMAQTYIDGTSSAWISARDESTEKTFSSVRTL